ncbi:hypothetical protein [Mycobacterium marinum]|uniref:hypothetical protein n=1 Tax=Mycobacterium marinum TaxID=1781 RepID=UPI0035653AB2
MRSLTFVAPGTLRFDEVDAPTILDPGDALVRPLAATTCDLDHHVIADKTPFSMAAPFALGPAERARSAVSTIPPDACVTEMRNMACP